MQVQVTVMTRGEWIGRREGVEVGDGGDGEGGNGEGEMGRGRRAGKSQKWGGKWRGGDRERYIRRGQWGGGQQEGGDREGDKVCVCVGVGG